MKAFRALLLYIRSWTPSIKAVGLGEIPIFPLYIGPGTKLRKIPSPSFLLGSGTWKNSDLSPLCEPWDLGKFQAPPSFEYSLLAM